MDNGSNGGHEGSGFSSVKVKVTILVLGIILVMTLIFMIPLTILTSQNEDNDDISPRPASSEKTEETEAPATEAPTDPPTEAPTEPPVHKELVTYHGHSYCLFDKALSWADAEALCVEMGGHLASVNSEDDQEFLKNLADSSEMDMLWIGAYADSSKKWCWADGTAFGKGYWAGEKSKELDGNGAMACKDSDSVKKGKWDSVKKADAEGKNIGFICEWPYLGETETFAVHSYQVIDLPLSWDLAEEYCENLGGHLAAINSEYEQEFIEKLTEKAGVDNVWLGGYFDTMDKKWKWADGSPFNYTNWESKKPDNYYGDEYYVKFPCRTQKFAEWSANRGKWDDVRITADGDKGDVPLSSFGFVCEWKYSNYEIADLEEIISRY